jgi:hypothetical protein
MPLDFPLIRERKSQYSMENAHLLLVNVQPFSVVDNNDELPGNIQKGTGGSTLLDGKKNE